MRNAALAPLLAVLALTIPSPALAAGHVGTGSAYHRHKACTAHERCVKVRQPVRERRSNPITVAQSLAVRYWHTAPCDGQITVTTEAPSSNDALNPDDAPTSMWASWTSAGGTDVEEAPTPYSDCHIGINPSVWKSAAQEGYEMWPEFSIDLIHEYGHLLGLPDLFDWQDTGNIMYMEPSADVAFTGEYAPGWG